MTCAQTTELLAAYADGGLEGQEQAEVAAHVRGCAACEGEVRILREVLGDTRRLGDSPPLPGRDDVFWTDMARDIRLAVAEEQKKAISWWRLPALTAAFAVAAAAVVWVVMKGPPERSPLAATTEAPAVVPSAPEAVPRKPLALPMVSEDLDDLDAEQLAAVVAALTPDYASANDDMVGIMVDDDELAMVSPAVAEAYVENLDDDDLARVVTAL